MSNFVAVILAGGLQTRFIDIYDDIPKAMAPVGHNQEPNLALLVNYLIGKGIPRIVIVAGFLSPVIEKYFESWIQKGVEVIVDPEGERLETGGAMRFALNHILSNPKSQAEHILYWNPDTLVTIDPVELCAHYVRKPFPASIVVTPDKSAPNFGAVRTVFHENFFIINSFNEGETSQFPNVHSFSECAHCGVGIIEISTLAKIFDIPDLKDKKPLCMWNEIMPKIVERGATAYLTMRRFLEWGSPKGWEILKNNPDWIHKAYDL